MRKISTAIVLAALMLAAGGCSQKENEVAPAIARIQPHASNQVVGSPEYVRGYDVGKNDALNLARSLSIPCPNLGPGTGPGREPDPFDPTPNDNTGTELTPTYGQGSNSFCFDSYGSSQFDSNTFAWREEAIRLADTAPDLATAQYYQGYAQGILEYQLP